MRIEVWLFGARLGVFCFSALFLLFLVQFWGSFGIMADNLASKVLDGFWRCHRFFLVCRAMAMMEIQTRWPDSWIGSVSGGMKVMV